MTFDTERVTEAIESHFNVQVTMNYHEDYDETDVWLAGPTAEVTKVVARLAAHPLLSTDVNEAGKPGFDVFMTVEKKSLEELFK